MAKEDDSPHVNWLVVGQFGKLPLGHVGKLPYDSFEMPPYYMRLEPIDKLCKMWHPIEQFAALANVEE